MAALHPRGGLAPAPMVPGVRCTPRRVPPVRQAFQYSLTQPVHGSFTVLNKPLMRKVRL